MTVNVRAKTQVMRSKVLSVDLRDRIVPRHRSGEGYHKMSPKNTVAYIILKWMKFGTKKTVPTAGHPAKLSTRRRRALVRDVNKNLMFTLTEL